MDVALQYLSEHPSFRDLDASELGQIARAATVRKLSRGEVLALEGDPCTSVCIVIEGRIRALKMSAQGREQVVAELQKGDGCYFAPAIDGLPLPVTTQAATRATLLCFSRDEFRSILDRHPSVAAGVLAEFAQRLRQLTSLVENLSLRTVPQRLAGLLLQRADDPTSHRMTQREMAAQLGTVREVVARALGDLSRRGLIDVQRGVIELLDRDALEGLAGAGEL